MRAIRNIIRFWKESPAWKNRYLTLRSIYATPAALFHELSHFITAFVLGLKPKWVTHSFFDIVEHPGGALELVDWHLSTEYKHREDSTLNNIAGFLVCTSPVWWACIVVIFFPYLSLYFITAGYGIRLSDADKEAIYHHLELIQG